MTGYAIRAIEAFPWYHQVGRFGREDLLAGKVALWNVIIGGGDVESPTTTTLVVVHAVGPSFVSGISGEVAITAHTRQAMLAEKRIPLSSLFTEKHTISTPLLIYGTGCDFVTVTATLTVNGKAASTMTRTIEFRCGE